MILPWYRTGSFRINAIAGHLCLVAGIAEGKGEGVCVPARQTSLFSHSGAKRWYRNSPGKTPGTCKLPGSSSEEP